MTLSRPWYLSLLIPSLVAMCLAGWFVYRQPGEIRKDAFEYDQIAHSLVEGRGYRFDGLLTMSREPGYPVLRAVVYGLGGSAGSILWLQVFLAGVVVWMVGDAFRSVSSNEGALGAAWGAVLAYGYAVYAASHYSEAFTGFLVTLVGWLAIRCFLKRAWHWYGLLVLASAALVLTRFNMAFIPPVLFFAIAMSSSPKWKPRMQILVLLGVSWAVMISPWVIRNGVRFHEWTVSGRSGIQFYARMVKAREPLSRLGASIVSVVSSHVASASLGLRPILGEDQWVVTWDRYRQLSEQGNQSAADVDRQLRREALDAITSSPRMVLGYIAWTPIEVLRLWALPSPGSPNFSIENTFYPAWMAGQLTFIKQLVLALAHLTQLLFWSMLVYALYSGWRINGWLWVPGWMFLALTLAHIPFDAIIRYGAPVQPWLWAAIGWMLVRELRQRCKQTHV